MVWSKALLLTLNMYYSTDEIDKVPVVEQQSGTCIASVFGYEDDEHKGGEAICVHRFLRPNEIGVASRDFKCGTKIMLTNPRTGKSVVARVVDSGPYGGKYKGRWVIKRKPTDPGVWRGCLDITRKAQQLLRHNGFEELNYYKVE